VKTYHGLDAVPAGAFQGGVCTIGVFDGVHRGHRQVLYELNAWARAAGGASCVVTFSRHPAEVLRGTALPMILGLKHRLQEFERLGVDACVVLEFAGVKDLDPRAFLRDVLLARLGCRRLLLGFDSRIGKDRAGDATNLPAMGRELGVEVRVATRVADAAGRKIGSSAIRDAILRGDLGTAAEMLGRPVALSGRVVPGAGRGRGLGTATANLDVEGELLPPDGVYLVRVFRGDATAPGVANVGRRPTFGAGGERGLEVHVPGWSGDLYGETLEVRLVRRVRGEVAFPDAAALRAQIARDLEELARAVASGEV